jgi:hypothetical protein
VEEDVRWEESMSERGVVKGLPGAEIRIRVGIQYQPMNFARAAASFTHREHEAVEVHLVGVPLQLEDQSAYPLLKALRGEAEITALVPRDAVPGVYDFNSLTLETAGGQTFHYTSDELGDRAALSFEVVAEPTEKPAIEWIRYMRRSLRP